MHILLKFNFIVGTLALTSDKVNHLPQQSILQNACESGPLLSSGKCHLSSFDISGSMPSTLAFRANLSQTSQSLDEARAMATKTPNFPWTFWPECFTDEEGNEPYCSFTDQTFASGRGIFILATKTFAYSMLEKPAFTDPALLETVNKYHSPAFYQQEFPGKGRGLVANKTLHRGDRIFSSTPILITDSDMYDLPDEERLALLYRGLDTLPAASQIKFWELMGHHGGDPLDDRFNTNNFEVSVDGVNFQALFPEIAMLNHDCRPNAAYAWDEEHLTHNIHAIRDIHPGEEITITYIDNERDQQWRLKKLQRNWGFKCDCSACTAHPSLVAESDGRLAQITELAQSLNDWTPTSTATPEMGELLVALFQQERLEASLATAYKHAAEVYSSFGKKWQAIKYARLSAEMSMLDKGFSDNDVKEMQKMAQNPEMTWSWNKRVALAKSCGCGHAH